MERGYTPGEAIQMLIEHASRYDVFPMLHMTPMTFSFLSDTSNIPWEDGAQ